MTLSHHATQIESAINGLLKAQGCLAANDNPPPAQTTAKWDAELRAKLMERGSALATFEILKRLEIADNERDARLRRARIHSILH